MTSIYAHPHWLSNTTEKTFGGPLAQNTTMEYYIIQGTVSFLDAYTHITHYLQKTEAMAIDAGSTLELKALLDRASVCMRQSNEYYRKLEHEARESQIQSIVTNWV